MLKKTLKTIKKIYLRYEPRVQTMSKKDIILKLKNTDKILRYQYIICDSEPVLAPKHLCEPVCWIPVHGGCSFIFLVVLEFMWKVFITLKCVVCICRGKDTEHILVFTKMMITDYVKAI